MGKMGSDLKTTIPTVNLSSFFHERDEAGRKEATEIIGHASQTSGFFRIVNHGLPLKLMNEAIELSKTFFDQPDKEKLGSKPVAGYPLPVGYVRPPNSPDKNEYLIVLSPERGVNVYPAEPPGFRSILDECFTELSRIALLVEDVLNDCLGLPPNFLKEYNKDARNDVMVALRYFPYTTTVTDTEKIGLSEHQDANYITFLFQDDIGGLEVLKDGEWISVDPIEGSIIVNIADVLQVITNNKFKSATHRVARRERHRHSIVFFGNVPGEKWIEPLPHFTSEIGVHPQYKGFWYKDYHQMRVRNKTHPPSRPEEIIHISHYAINPCN